jgi:hypothetical protein
VLATGQTLGTAGFITSFAEGRAQAIDTNSFGFSVDGVFSVTEAYREAAATLNEWVFVSHRDLGDGLTALTLRDPSGEYWVFFDGVDLSSPTPGEAAADAAQAGAILVGGGFDPRGSAQFERAQAYIDELRSVQGVPNGRLSISGQSLGGVLERVTHTNFPQLIERFRLTPRRENGVCHPK